MKQKLIARSPRWLIPNILLRTQFSLACVGICFCGIACQSTQHPRDYFDAEAWHLVQSAEIVEARLLDSKGAADADKASDVDFGNGITADYRSDVLKPSESWLKRLRAELDDPSRYMWDSAKGCLPMPGVEMRFSDGDRSAVLLLCFECKMLSIAMDEQSTRWEDFDPMHTALVKLAKELFPGDEKIAALH